MAALRIGPTLAVALSFAGLWLSAAITSPEDVEKLLSMKETLIKRGPKWTAALESWVCPTNADGTCDPCNNYTYWGDTGRDVWHHMGCRGGEGAEGSLDDPPGNSGYVTNLHITDLKLEGPVPAEEFCRFKKLKEMDLDGGYLTGAIPEVLATCGFTQLTEIDLSFNRLTGRVPASLANITSLQEVKVENNNEMTGTIPPELGLMRSGIWFEFENNKFSGIIPRTYGSYAVRNPQQHLFRFEIAANNFEGDLYSLAGAHPVTVRTAGNPQLCGMVPADVRWAHGYNAAGTKLGKPCPGASYPPMPEEINMYLNASNSLVLIGPPLKNATQTQGAFPL